MSVAVEQKKSRLYGGLYHPKGFGYGPFGPIGTGLLFAGMFGILPVIFIFGLAAALVYIAVGGIGLAVSAMPDKNRQTMLDKAGDRLGWKAKVRRTGALYLGNSLVGVGSQELPGVLGKTELYGFNTAAGEPASFVYYPEKHLYATTASCEPEGIFGLDPDEVDGKVTRFHEYLKLVAHEPDLIQLAVTVESSPDGGAGLSREVDRQRDGRASAVASNVMRSIVETFPSGQSGLSAWSTLTFEAPKPEVNEDGTKHRAKRDGPDAIRSHLSLALPHLLEDLPATGAGAVTPLTAQEMIEVVRVAYNPGDKKLFDQIKARGDVPPEMRWDYAGPTAAKDDHFTHYVHSDGVSITWEFTDLTSSAFPASALLPLLAAHDDIVTKRVTFLYQPIDPALAAITAEKDHRSNAGRQLNSKKPTARLGATVSSSDTTRQAEAGGAALVNVAILVTATVADTKDRKKAEMAIRHIGPAARLLLRRADGVQDQYFAQALGPLGLVSRKFVTIPTAVQNGL